MKKKDHEYYSEWICDDRSKPMSPEFAAMTEEERKAEVIRRFGKYLTDEDLANI